jgi:predicted molibdopterin-dependent oxidoreductase YjgC
MNHGDRIEAPLLLSDGDLVATDWDNALHEAARIVRGSSGRAIALVSPNASNEALYLARQLLEKADFHGAFRVERVENETALPGVANLALRSERAANVAGAMALGYREEFEKAISTLSDASLVLVVDESLEGVARSVLSDTNVIYLGAVLPDSARGAKVVLPVANVAEEDGTFVNRDRRVQRYFQAKTSPGMARPAWWVLGQLLHELGRGEPLFSAEAAFDLLAETEQAFAGLSYEHLGVSGRAMTEAGKAGVTA